MARHAELVGQPACVKRILCEGATDLSRSSHYQGAGMLDALCALRSVRRRAGLRGGSWIPD